MRDAYETAEDRADRLEDELTYAKALCLELATVVNGHVGLCNDEIGKLKQLGIDFNSHGVTPCDTK